MRNRTFGRSGLRVSEISLSTMNFGDPVREIDAEASRPMLDADAKAGGNFLDTAHLYGNDGASERIVGDLVAADRDDFVIATRYAPSMSGGVMRAFDDMMRTGKVRCIAISDTPAWQIARADMLANPRGWPPFIGIRGNIASPGVAAPRATGCAPTAAARTSRLSRAKCRPRRTRTAFPRRRSPR